jgi:tryptophanyl-tRNA synthetase
MPQFVVTPWEVSGEVDYDRLIKEFGTEAITDKLLDRIKKHTKDLHLLLRRKLFFSHRDMDWVLNEYEKGNKFYLYTGRAPSGPVHVGHLVPWMFTKWLQDKFNAELWFQFSDEEKFLSEEKLTFEKVAYWTDENMLDIIAIGFNSKKTHFLIDTKHADLMYKQACRIAKKITYSTAKAVFGFTNQDNIGKIFYTSMQAVLTFLPSILAKKNIPCLIPMAIDQDPHFRVCRDVMPKLGFYKPAAIHSKFLPGLGEGGKMSASQPNTCIFTTDEPDVVEKKIHNAFTGGGGSLKEQKEKGGNPDVCTIYQYLFMLFEVDDKKIEELGKKCRAGEIICGDCKKNLTKKINDFLKEHRKKREKARNKLDDFIVKD